jgi:hypothetical protein
VKAYSTKIARRVPVEFEPTYIKYGQAVCEQMFGKRATTRCRFAIGASKLKRARRAYLDSLTDKTVSNVGQHAV